MSRSTASTVLTALGFSAEVDRLYQRLRAQSGRHLARVAASMLRTPDELLEALTPLVEAGIVRVTAGVLEVDPPAEALRTVVAAQSVDAERVHRRLDRVTDAIGLLAAEEDRPASPDVGVPLEG